MTATHDGIQFTDDDIVNPDEFFANVGCGNYKPHLLHDHGFVLCVVFAETAQDAIDQAADAGKLDAFAVTDDELPDYGPEGDGLSYCGNACTAYDLECLGVIELPNPPFSFTTLFAAAFNA